MMGVPLSGTKKRLFSNFLSLLVLQATLYLLPLITLPYLVRTLGAEKYGLVMFSLSLSQYFMYLVDYGFYLSGTRLIATNRDDPNKLAILVSELTGARIILFVISAVLLAFLLAIVPQFRVYWVLHALTFLMVLGQLLFPVWFFQGMERMEFITLVQLASRLLFTILIFVLISSEEDYLRVPILNALGFGIGGVISLLLVYRYFKVPFIMPSFSGALRQLKENWFVFITDFMPNLYNNSSTFILGLVAPSHIVGYFAAATKILNAVLQGVQVISRTVFPFLNRNFSCFRKAETLILFIGATLSVGLFSFAPLISDIFFTTALAEVGKTLRIMSPSPFFIAMIACYGTNFLLIKKEDRRYMHIMIFSSLLGFFIALIVIPLFHHIGAAIVVTISRAVIAVACLIAVKNLCRKHSPHPEETVW